MRISEGNIRHPKRLQFPKKKKKEWIFILQHTLIRGGVTESSIWTGEACLNDV